MNVQGLTDAQAQALVIQLLPENERAQAVQAQAQAATAQAQAQAAQAAEKLRLLDLPPFEREAAYNMMNGRPGKYVKFCLLCFC